MSLEAIGPGETCTQPLDVLRSSPPRMGQTQGSRVPYAKVKRIVDVVLVLLISPAAAIVVGLAALAIAVAMGRPIFFLSERVGRNGRRFQMLKLRTMSVHTGKALNATLRNDPRVTPVGNLLRHTHIDELPQLWNILVGDMTLIGPRPEQAHLVEYYRERIPNYDLRHSVCPGLSGWSQVCFGYAADVEETAKKLTYDLEYINRYGPRIDFEVFCRTLRVYLNPNYVR
jgi:lipopolysaccharide/colanic/teichoic acid biosynthesis glycosyltransferase